MGVALRRQKAEEKKKKRNPETPLAHKVIHLEFWLLNFVTLNKLLESSLVFTSHSLTPCFMTFYSFEGSQDLQISIILVVPSHL